ncbi:hypothetical protein [Streptomyces sp. NPDC051219]|uniref:hypothetical protein n=1 Tax=Streptomyces sp. NPDC051219 TaxID=3155283 RepID=UPI0034142ECB
MSGFAGFLRRDIDAVTARHERASFQLLRIALPRRRDSSRGAIERRPVRAAVTVTVADILDAEADPEQNRGTPQS